MNENVTYNENLCEAIDILVSERLNKITYDQTELCKILEIQENGYFVTNGSLKYTVQALNEDEYKVGDSIYVQIPQGNFDGNKFIIGKYNSKEEKKEKVLVNPLDDITIDKVIDLSSQQAIVKTQKNLLKNFVVDRNCTANNDGSDGVNYTYENGIFTLAGTARSNHRADNPLITVTGEDTNRPCYVSIKNLEVFTNGGLEAGTTYQAEIQYISEYQPTIELSFWSSGNAVGSQYNESTLTWPEGGYTYNLLLIKFEDGVNYTGCSFIPRIIKQSAKLEDEGSTESEEKKSFINKIDDDIFNYNRNNRPYNQKGYDYIGMEFVFNVDCPKETSGEYGFDFKLQTSDGKEAVYTFNNDELYGNPYQMLPLKNHCLWEFPKNIFDDITKINNVSVELFESNFTTSTTIILSDVKVFFGYKKIQKDSCYLSLSKTTTNNYPLRDGNGYLIADKKTLYLTLEDAEHNKIYNIDSPLDINNPPSFSINEETGEPDKWNYNIYWLHHHLNSGSTKAYTIPDEYGWNWQPSGQDGISYNQFFNLDPEMFGEFTTTQCKAVIEFYLQDLSGNKVQQKFYESNIFEFINTNFNAVPEEITYIKDGITFTTDRTTFNSYDIDGKLSDTGISQRDYKIKATITGIPETDHNYTNIKSVEWVYPTSGTMIKHFQDLLNNDSKDYFVLVRDKKEYRAQLEQYRQKVDSICVGVENCLASIDAIQKNIKNLNYNLSNLWFNHIIDKDTKKMMDELSSFKDNKLYQAWESMINFWDTQSRMEFSHIVNDDLTVNIFNNKIAISYYIGINEDYPYGYKTIADTTELEELQEQKKPEIPKIDKAGNITIEQYLQYLLIILNEQNREDASGNKLVYPFENYRENLANIRSNLNKIVFENNFTDPVQKDAAKRLRQYTSELYDYNWELYSINKLINEHVIRLQTLLSEASQIMENYNEVYTSIGKQNLKTSIDISATYRVNSQYLGGANNNTIICRIVYGENNITYEGSITLNFGDISTAATDYALNIDFIGDNCCLTWYSDTSQNYKDYPLDPGRVFQGSAEPLAIKATLINTTSNSEIENIKYKWSWHTTTLDSNIEYVKIFKEVTKVSLNDYKYLGTVIDNEFFGNMIYLGCLNNQIDKSQYYYILKCETTVSLDNGTSRILTAYLPIPLKTSTSSYRYCSGPVKILYDSVGNIYYDKSNYLLYSNSSTPISITNAQIYSKKIEYNNKILPSSYAPALKQNNNQYYLIPAMTLTEEIPYVNIVLNNIWIQPILLLKHNYFNDYVNNWDGSVKIEEDIGMIASPTFLAGKKEADGTLTGVMIGEVYYGEDNKYKKPIGIYGFQNGNPVFSLNENGEFILRNEKYSYLVGEDISILENKFEFTKEKFELYHNVNGNTIEINNFTFSLMSANNKAYFFFGPTTNSSDEYTLSIKTTFLDLQSNGLILKTDGIYEEAANVYWGVIDCYGVDIDNRKIDKIKISGLHGLEIYNNGFTIYNRGTTNRLLSTVDNGITIHGSLSIADLNDSSAQGLLISSKSDKTNNYEETTISQTVSNKHNYLTLKCQGTKWNMSDGTIKIPEAKINLYCAYDGPNSACYIYSDVLQHNGVTLGTTGSDIKIKHNINSLSDKYSIFFDKISPVSFIYNKDQYGYGTSQRTHIGFIANKIEIALLESGLTTQDFAGLVIQDRGTENELYTLRYEEFISLNTWQIQKLKTRVTELENEIKELKQHYEI